MEMRRGNEYKSERVESRDFEKLGQEAGLAKPIVRRRVPELAEGALAALRNTGIANPVTQAVGAPVRRRCEAILNRFRN